MVEGTSFLFDMARKHPVDIWFSRLFFLIVALLLLHAPCFKSDENREGRVKVYLYYYSLTAGILVNQ